MILYPLMLNWIIAAFNKASLKVQFFRVTKFSRYLPQFP